MALDPVILDDLRWRDMIDAARARIAAASDGKWTLHAPVDPGVTLLELFGWLLEQRVYWMDQVSEPMVRAALALLGQRTEATRCAATVLGLRGAAGGGFQDVPAGTVFQLAQGAPALAFSTVGRLALLPLGAPLQVWIGGHDRTPDLTRGQVLRLFSSSGGSEQVKIAFWLRQPLPAPAPGGRFGLLFQLHQAATPAPHWAAPGGLAVAPPAALSWWYRNAPHAPEVRFAAGQVDDGTQGLRRSGVVRLALPADWQPEQVDGAGAAQYALWLKVEQATFAFPPRLAQLIPNAALAVHRRRTRLHQLAQHWLPLPGNRIELSRLTSQPPAADMPLADLPPLEAGFRLWLRERAPLHGPPPRWHRWRPTADLARHGPADRVFVLDREQATLAFGDGLAGRIPLLADTDAGAPCNVRLRYRVGGGSAGLVGHGREWRGPAALAAANAVDADGGAEAETVDAARQRAAAGLRQVTRAVTAADFEQLAVTTPGVAIGRAHAAIGLDPAQPCRLVPGAATVFVVPAAPRGETSDDWLESAFVAAPLPDPGALLAVRARLEAARLLASEVFVRAPRYRAVALRVTLESDPADAVALERAVRAQLEQFLDPLVGGDGHDGWPFGEPLRPAVLLREVQRALGDSGIASEVAIGLDGAAPTESCLNVPVGPHALVWLARLTLQLRRSACAGGGLR